MINCRPQSRRHRPRWIWRRPIGRRWTQGARAEDIAAAEAAVRSAEAQVKRGQRRARSVDGRRDRCGRSRRRRRDLSSALVEQKLAQDAYDKVTECVTCQGRTKCAPASARRKSRRACASRRRMKRVNAARSALTEATKGSGKQVQAAQANVAAAKAQRDIAQAQLDRLKAGATAGADRGGGGECGAGRSGTAGRASRVERSDVDRAVRRDDRGDQHGGGAGRGAGISRS